MFHLSPPLAKHSADDRGHEKKGAKTPFVILKGNVK